MELIDRFIQQHKLPPAFHETASRYYLPIAQRLVDRSRSQVKPLMVGIHGCQGSGKSTLTEFLCFLFEENYSEPCVGVSIDDFYHTRVTRVELGRQVHPLLRTRGVPGTHDTALMSHTLAQLSAGVSPLKVPRFNKAIDDRLPETEWSVLNKPVQIVLFEGWCVGVPAQPYQELLQVINELERQEDDFGHWRKHVNEQLKGSYSQVFSNLDCLIMLQAPGFHTVKNWRLEQERRLADRLAGSDTSALMSESEIERFIQHYQRLTEHALKVLPPLADELLILDEQRQVISARVGSEVFI